MTNALGSAGNKQSGWYRLVFSQAQTAAFSDTLQKIHDSQRHANWSLETSVFVTDDWTHLDGVPSLVIYFPPAAAEIFAELIEEMGAEPCLKPLPFGLNAHGNWAAQKSAVLE